MGIVGKEGLKLFYMLNLNNYAVALFVYHLPATTTTSECRKILDFSFGANVFKISGRMSFIWTSFESFQQWTNYWWLDLNLGPLMSEATALPTVPQPILSKNNETCRTTVELIQLGHATWYLWSVVVTQLVEPLLPRSGVQILTFHHLGKILLKHSMKHSTARQIDYLGV